MKCTGKERELACELELLVCFSCKEKGGSVTEVEMSIIHGRNHYNNSNGIDFSAGPYGLRSFSGRDFSPL